VRSSQTEELPLGLFCSFSNQFSSRAASQAAPERENLTSALAREIFGLPVFNAEYSVTVYLENS
jgi:hypothetical protein